MITGEHHSKEKLESSTEYWKTRNIRLFHMLTRFRRTKSGTGNFSLLCTV